MGMLPRPGKGEADPRVTLPPKREEALSTATRGGETLLYGSGLEERPLAVVSWRMVDGILSRALCFPGGMQTRFR